MTEGVISMSTKNGCWNCARAEVQRGGRVWCSYWQAYFSLDYTGCEPPAFLPIVTEDEDVIIIEEHSDDIDFKPFGLPDDRKE
jgi:hypothetical protein